MMKYLSMTVLLLLGVVPTWAWAEDSSFSRDFGSTAGLRTNEENYFAAYQYYLAAKTAEAKRKVSSYSYEYTYTYCSTDGACQTNGTSQQINGYVEVSGGSNNDGDITVTTDGTEQGITTNYPSDDTN